MPTRLAKQLAQVVYGGVAIGLSREEAIRLAIRCARDTVPPLRPAIILDVAKEANSSPADVGKRLNKPWTTIDRQLQALYMLGVLRMEEREEYNLSGKLVSRSYYTLAEDVEPTALTSPESQYTGIPG